MVLGYNHNIMYKGEVFHVQTEDSGIATPHIITLLYKGGVILCSRKTSYADILKIESLEEVVAELMKEQHKEMMRRLKAGDFDERAFAVQTPASVTLPMETPESDRNSVESIFPASQVRQATSPRADISLLFEMPAGLSSEPARTEAVDVAPKSIVSLDDAILSFFGANEK